MDSETYCKGRPRNAFSEDLVFICDNGLDKHAKNMFKLSEPMGAVCTKRFAFDYFLVPLRMERKNSAVEIHEQMFAKRNENITNAIADRTVFSSVSSSNSSSDDDDNVPLSKLNFVEASRKRESLLKTTEKIAALQGIKFSEEIPEILKRTSPPTAVASVSNNTEIDHVVAAEKKQTPNSQPTSPMQFDFYS